MPLVTYNKCFVNEKQFLCGCLPPYENNPDEKRPIAIASQALLPYMAVVLVFWRTMKWLSIVRIEDGR